MHKQYNYNNDMRTRRRERHKQSKSAFLLKRDFEYFLIELLRRVFFNHNVPQVLSAVF